MPDDIELDAGSGGSVLATDQVAGGQHYQRVKLTDGTADATTIIAAGNGVAANALRVTLASDGTGVVKLWDGTDTALVTAGGLLQVEASAGTNLNTSALALEAGGNLASAATLLGTIDADTSVLAALSKAEDAGHSSGDTGVMMLAVRQDTFGSLSGATGDYTPLQVDANGLLKVEVYDGAGNELDLMKDSDNVAIGADHGLAALTRDDGTPSQYHFLRSRDADEALYVADANAITALQIMDDWDESDRAKVNLIVGQAGIAAGTGVDGATVPRVTLATNVALPAGTNAIGKLAANSGVDIGDVDVTSVVTGTGATNLGKAEDAAHSSGDTGVMMLGVSAAAATATAGAEGDYQPLSVSSANGRLFTSATVDAALPAGTNAIGKLAANSGVDIGDVDVTSIVPGSGATNLGKAEDAAHSSGDVGVMALGVRDDAWPAVTSGTDGDYEPLHVGARGGLWVTELPPDHDVTLHANYIRKYYSAATPTDGIIWSPAAGKRWHVVSMFINVSAASTITLEDDKAGGDDPVMAMQLAANSGLSINFSEKYPMASAEDAADLLITATAGTVYVTVTGYEV